VQQGLEEVPQRAGIRLLRRDAPIYRLQDARNLALLGERGEGNEKR